MAASASVLVTRPEGQGDELCAAARKEGFVVHSLPLLCLQPVGEPGATQQRILRNLDHYQHIIFVSTNAVKHGMEWIQAYWQKLPEGPSWYAVGEATARLLGRHGIQAGTPGPAMNSEGNEQ
jgi:uroporphyrinogen-III synthase